MRKYKLTKRCILYSKSLCTFPYETEIVRLYAKFMKEHPELSEEEVRCAVYEVDTEEDYYGNGGGTERILKIYVEKEEDDDEYKSRMRKYEDNIIDDCLIEINKLTNTFSNKIYELPEEYRDEAFMRLHNLYIDSAKKTLAHTK